MSAIMKDTDHNENINKLSQIVKSYGGVVNFSKKLGIHHSCISKWLYGVVPIPIKQAIQIENLTNGKIMAKELRPDVFKKSKDKKDK